MYVSNGSLIKKGNVAVGEYYADIHLIKEFEARNWIEYRTLNISAAYTWAEDKLKWKNSYSSWLRAYIGYNWLKATKPWNYYNYTWDADNNEYPVEVNNYL